MKKVLIPTKLDAIARQTLESNGRYTVIQDAKTPILDLAAAHPDTYALIVRSEKVTPQLIDALPALKVIVRAGAGYNTIDIKHARHKGVDVMNTPGANSNAVAEEVVAMILADARHLIPADASCRTGAWEKDKFMGRELTAKTVGIVGLGSIGRLLARRLSGFECRLLGYDPIVSSDRAGDVNVELTTLERLFEESDYVSLHIPENDSTRNLVGNSLLSLMKNGATLVNCARSGVLDEEALRRLKAEKGIRFLNDVYPADKEGPKAVADIADIMLPHLGASTVEANSNAARQSAQQIIDLDEKGVTSYIVNRDIPDGLDPTYCDLAFSLAHTARSLCENMPVREVEASFYGSLEPFANWLLVPIVSGISADFDRTLDSGAAKAYLKDMGIAYSKRDADAGKGYGNSITVDLIVEQDANNLKRVSLRGTVAEGIAMISRINEFDRLYFEPKGPTVFFVYDDRPGVLGAIGISLAKAGINIEDVRNPHDNRTNTSLAIMKLSQPAPESVVAAIKAEIRARSAFSVKR